MSEARGAHPVEVSNPDKVLIPDGITKADIVEYLERVADLMLPPLTGRPLVVRRLPDGIETDGFFQKNLPDHAPDWIERHPLPKVEGGTTTYATVADASGLAWFGDQGAIEFHVLLCRVEAPDRPVEVVFDLDPADGDLGPVRRVARDLRSVLDDLGLTPRVKSSGLRGLHVHVDVTDDDADFDLTRRFARAVALLVAERQDATLEQRIDRREGRLFLDVLRNAPGAHAVAPWSPRARPGAPIAVPLDWDEALASSFHPRRITLGNVFRRLGQKTDPWAQAPRPRVGIAEALAALSGH